MKFKMKSEKCKKDSRIQGFKGSRVQRFRTQNGEPGTLNGGLVAGALVHWCTGVSQRLTFCLKDIS